jgi:hypothetical protein
MVEGPKVETDGAGPPHDLAAIATLVAVAENHSGLLVLVPVFPGPGSAAHDLLTRLDVNELLVREQVELPLPGHFYPREQASPDRYIDQVRAPRALTVAEARAALNNPVCQVLGRVRRKRHEEAEHLHD